MATQLVHDNDPQYAKNFHLQLETNTHNPELVNVTAFVGDSVSNAETQVTVLVSVTKLQEALQKLTR